LTGLLVVHPVQPNGHRALVDDEAGELIATRHDHQRSLVAWEQRPHLLGVTRVVEQEQHRATCHHAAKPR
jgi:hypothetical protein